MKNYKKILLLLLGMLIIVGTTYAWKAGGGVKWIGEVDQSNRFTDYSTNTSDYGTGYYLDTYTGLKWQAKSGLGLEWALDESYEEPIWNGASYEYPNGLTEDDYPAFKYCTDIGDGWRLPNRREMFSIMTDIQLSGNDYFSMLPSIIYDNYWSSIDEGDSSWYGDFLYGSIYMQNKTNVNYTICVHD